MFQHQNFNRETISIFQFIRSDAQLAEISNYPWLRTDRKIQLNQMKLVTGII